MGYKFPYGAGSEGKNSGGLELGKGVKELKSLKESICG